MSNSILSIFVDESGVFGLSHPSRYYIVSMVLHNQSSDISSNISAFDAHLRRIGYTHHLIHSGPLIRREPFYIDDSLQSRRFLFNSLLGFAAKLPISYLCAKVLKKECSDTLSLLNRLSKAIGLSLQRSISYFSSFDCIIVYYDNGQAELTKILSTVFNTLFANVEFRTAKQADYKLLQVADLICTMELLSEKAESSSFSKSETEFFGSPRNFRKNYLKHLREKRL